jgi:hypothetical protein
MASRESKQGTASLPPARDDPLRIVVESVHGLTPFDFIRGPLPNGEGLPWASNFTEGTGTKLQITVLMFATVC